MPEPSYYLDPASHRKVAATIARLSGEPVNNNAPQKRETVRVERPIVRLGIAYGTIPAATWLNGVLISPGVGEAKFQRLAKDGTGLIGLDDQPTKVYSIVTEEIPDGQTAMFLRDRTIDDPAKPNVANEGYVAIRADGGSGGEERHFYICGGDAKSIADNDTYQKLYVANYANFDASTYEANAAEWSVSLKRAGYYTVRHDFVIEITTSGGVDSQEASTVYYRAGNNVSLDSNSVIPCSAIPLRGTNAGTKADHDIGGCTYYVRAINNSPPYTKIDWVAKRVVYTNGHLIYPRTIHIRYHGTTAPTLGSFDDPTP